jgi:hypothetical protein
MLSDEERELLVSALWDWSEAVPDRPLIGFLEHRGLLTPREVAQAVQEETPDGEALLAILEYGIRREGIETVTERIVTSIGER